MTYEAAVRYLYSLGNEVQTAKLGLDRISRLLAALGNPERRCRFVHIAGTNGKGSTAAMIESGLRAAGWRTGLYTSPHLVEPVERIAIEGQPISREEFAAMFDRVHAAAEELLAGGEIDLHPTYFETVTAMAFCAFAEHGLDWVALEVGLGGRLDATNVVQPDLCVITRIDLDHQAFLGNTIERIAAEKAGILKSGVPAVIGPQFPGADSVLRGALKGPTTFPADWPVEDLDITPRGSRFRVRHLTVECPLAGEHQVENARTAAIALDLLGVSPAGIAQAHWPARLERVRERPEIILDGAHNPGGVRALAAYIRGFYGGRTIWIVYGVMKDKDAREMTDELFPLAQRVILTKPDNARAMPPERIVAPGAVVTESVAQALARVREAGPDDVVFITGSLFVAGEARALLLQ